MSPTNGSGMTARTRPTRATRNIRYDAADTTAGRRTGGVESIADTIHSVAAPPVGRCPGRGCPPLASPGRWPASPGGQRQAVLGRVQVDQQPVAVAYLSGE